MLEQKYKGRDQCGVCECACGCGHSDAHLRYNGQERLTQKVTFEESEEDVAIGVAVEEDDPRIGTSKCKGPGVEHTWLPRNIQGKNGGCIGVRSCRSLTCLEMKSQSKDLNRSRMI